MNTSENTLPEHKKTVSEVFALNSQDYRPFVELFHHEPKNFTQKDLGSIFGLFAIPTLDE